MDPTASLSRWYEGYMEADTQEMEEATEDLFNWHMAGGAMPEISRKHWGNILAALHASVPYIGHEPIDG